MLHTHTGQRAPEQQREILGRRTLGAAADAAATVPHSGPGIRCRRPGKHSVVRTKQPPPYNPLLKALGQFFLTFFFSFNLVYYPQLLSSFVL